MDKIKRQTQQQTTISNIEKENNIKKRSKKRRNLEKKMIDLKTLNLHLETNLRIQQKKENQELGSNIKDMTKITRKTEKLQKNHIRKEKGNKIKI